MVAVFFFNFQKNQFWFFWFFWLDLNRDLNHWFKSNDLNQTTLHSTHHPVYHSVDDHGQMYWTWSSRGSFFLSAYHRHHEEHIEIPTSKAVTSRPQGERVALHMARPKRPGNRNPDTPTPSSCPDSTQKFEVWGWVEVFTPLELLCI